MQDRPKALDVKIFVPAKDFKTSLDFYTQLGWQLNWEHEGDLAEFLRKKMGGEFHDLCIRRKRAGLV